mmetsp:Transcript_19572/g.42558  ORF Transcript_19572/g.42558 Transcript_19572/m.42558 type:complete len:560 (-) Transcript_19572:3569-5248(-)
MPTMRNIRKIPRNKNRPEKILGDHRSVEESLDVTLSMSPTSNREDISWSSSDGSTYYSETDEIPLKKRRHARQVSRPKGHGNAVAASSKSNKVKNSDKITDGKKEASQGTKDFERENTTIKRNSLLVNVDSFTGIDVATSNEELSAVGFLTTEDTAKVFCTSNIPFEVDTAEKFSFEISAFSPSTDDSDSSVITSCSRSDGAVRHYQENTLYRTASKTSSATITSQFIGINSSNNLIPPINEHSVDVISLSNQEPVSSLEYESSWDDLSLDSDNSRDGDEKVKNSISQKTKASSAQSLKPVTPFVDSKVSKIKQMQRGKSETDERIKQLKAKIKNIQELKYCSSSVVNRSEDISSAQVESFLSLSSPSQRGFDNEMIEREGDCDTDASTPLRKRHCTGESQQRNVSKSTKDEGQRISSDYNQEADEALLSRCIPLMIPVLEREEISVMDFDDSATQDAVIDVEAGRPAHGRLVGSVRSSTLSKRGKVEREKIYPIYSRTKVLLTQTKTKVLAAYDYLSAVIKLQRMEFQEKPRNEQGIMIAIGVLSIIFLILLFVMMIQ